MPDEVYRDLQRHLDKMPIGYPATESGVEIRLLKQLFSEREAEAALCLSAVPESLEHIHRRSKKIGIGVEELEKILDRLAHKGVIERQVSEKGKRYGKSIFVVGIYERQLTSLTREFQKDVLQYLEEGFGETLHTKNTTQLRTVPINVSILPDRQVGTYDDARKIVLQSEGPFGVMDCICRKGMELLDQPCQQTDIRETCLTLGGVAQSCIDKEMARPISQEEMVRLLEQAEDEGMVLQPQNCQDPSFICCCCGCCCGVLTSAKRLPHPAEYFNTNFYAVVDEAACLGCGTCVTRCQMEALETNDETTTVLVDRCIGCGLCVSTCPSDALSLLEKDKTDAPPKDMNALYKRIMFERFGFWGMTKALGKKLLGMKI